MVLRWIVFDHAGAGRTPSLERGTGSGAAFFRSAHGSSSVPPTGRLGITLRPSGSFGPAVASRSGISPGAQKRSARPAGRGIQQHQKGRQSKSTAGANYGPHPGKVGRPWCGCCMVFRVPPVHSRCTANATPHQPNQCSQDVSMRASPVLVCRSVWRPFPGCTMNCTSIHPQAQSRAPPFAPRQPFLDTGCPVL
jgi:hypothetical protein